MIKNDPPSDLAYPIINKNVHRLFRIIKNHRKSGKNSEKCEYLIKIALQLRNSLSRLPLGHVLPEPATYDILGEI